MLQFQRCIKKCRQRSNIHKPNDKSSTLYKSSFNCISISTNNLYKSISPSFSLYTKSLYSSLTQSSKRIVSTSSQSLLHNKTKLSYSTSAKPKLSDDDFLTGSSGQYVDALFEKWQSDPNSVDNSWGNYFKSGEFLKPKSSSIKVPNLPKTTSGEFSLTSPEVMRAINDATNLMQLVRCYQSFGHFVADLDPLQIFDQGIDRKQFAPEVLTIEHWGFTQADLDRQIYVGEHAQFFALMNRANGYVTLREVVERLKKIYCGTIGFQYMHIANIQKNNFLKHLIEKVPTPLTKEEKIRILDRLTWADLFEGFLDVKYQAQKRFGIIGAESTVPLLKEIIDEGARLGMDEFIIGMPHRGRLIVLATVLRKPLELIFHEFRGLALPGESPVDSGDVKYHLGASQDRETPDNIKVHLSLLPNPSHLEAVDTAVMGKARAKQHHKKDIDRSKTMAIIIHGDASFCGQGVVYEAMALTDLPDYTTGGVMHVIVNNQIGFTTDPYEARSSPYCTDVARSTATPIFHVNGDDPEAVVRVAKMATHFRQNFKADAVIDILCFRRYGHNEGDDPSFTQPLMYQIINNKMKTKDTVLNKYRKKLIEDKVITKQEIDEMEKRINSILIDAYEKSAEYEVPPVAWLERQWYGLKGPNELGTEKNTGISEKIYDLVGKSLTTFPENFNLHRTLKKIMEKRAHSIDTGENIDWGTGESLAYGSLVHEGIHVRLSGQDSERGTFSHRHAVVHEQLRVDKLNRPKYVPLNSIPGSKEEFHVMNSNLSEYGVLGYEYGYASENPKSLVIWEAQFGDFCNGAQVVFDQFISSSEAKWSRQNGLVCLLPHGYEGGGPEHSSTRIERFLQMCNDAEDIKLNDLNPVKQLQQINWQILNCTTPANFFHALRRQVHRDFRKPLIVATPKYGLRHPLAVSNKNEFLNDTHFLRLIPELGTGLPNGTKSLKPDNKIRKIIFCSGKIWLNFMEHRIALLNNKNLCDDIVFLRVEQVAPFPYDLVQQQVQKYPNAEIIWAQEEPKNMGCWFYVQPRFNNALNHLGINNKKIKYIGRRPASAPATGYPQVHRRENDEITKETFS